MDFDDVMRALVAAGLVGIAALALFYRSFFVEIDAYFRRAALRLSWIALIGSFLTAVASSFILGHRFAGTAVAFSVLTLAVVAWRIAVAPALLVGVDPEWEYVVDERLRAGRARSIAVLGCVMASLFASIAAPSIAGGHAAWVPVLANGFALVALFESARVQWQGLQSI